MVEGKLNTEFYIKKTIKILLTAITLNKLRAPSS